MSKKAYNPHEIEAKWRARWPKERSSYIIPKGAQKYYTLDMISYPSSEGLHMGHWRPYTIADTWARYQTLLGKHVLSPVGFDAFGLPAENAAVKSGTPPAEYTARSITNFSRQIQEMGKMYDWSTLISTASPEYYKWTQWIFIQLYKNGLAYKKEAPVWWCPKDQTVLANEQVIDGECERCGTLVVRKNLRQWFFKITDFAEDLLNFDGLHWPERVKTLQTNWIGKSQGTEIHFPIQDGNDKITVFTTRPDTLFGVTYLVVAPEHPLVSVLTTSENQTEVQKYIEVASKKSDIDRMTEDRQKTGVFTGSYVIHPFTQAALPVWVADYVIGSYGTGAVMAVPAHDQRDLEFAHTYGLPVVTVIDPLTGTPRDDAKEKNKIVAVVENDKGEILTINWGSKLGGRLLIGGTAEGDEDPLTTARREVTEETGYYDLELIEKGEETIHHHYFAHSKNQAHLAHTTVLHFRLTHTMTKAQNLDESEKENFKVEWVSKAQAETEIVESLHRYALDKFIFKKAYTGDGLLSNSQEFDGLDNRNAIEVITQKLEEMHAGSAKTQFKIRDWLISRQRSWGPPIPIIYCDTCGEQPVPETDLPVKLPDDLEFLQSGGSPLNRHPSFKHTTCPQCGGAALRDVDTLDTFVDSSWYYLRFTDPKNDEKAFSYDQVKAWMPVDFYVGGIEHSILHLLYSRFIMKALHRLNLVPYHEPFQTFYGNGMVYLNGKKMSKSKGNIVNPDDMVKQYGTDALRGYILFMGPADQDVEWQMQGINGVRRFLDRAWNIFLNVNASARSDTIHPAILKAYSELQTLLSEYNFNRCISTLMIAVNEIKDAHITHSDAEAFIKLFAPFFPHFAEEIWEHFGHSESIFVSRWPELMVIADTHVTYVVQVNGKVRGTVEATQETPESDIIQMAHMIEAVKTQLDGKAIHKTIVVPGRIVNFVV